MPDRDSKIAQLVIRIPVVLKTRLKVHCIKAGITMQEFCVEAIRGHLDSTKPQNRSAINP